MSDLSPAPAPMPVPAGAQTLRQALGDVIAPLVPAGGVVTEFIADDEDLCIGYWVHNDGDVAAASHGDIRQSHTITYRLDRPLSDYVR